MTPELERSESHPPEVWPIPDVEALPIGDAGTLPANVEVEEALGVYLAQREEALQALYGNEPPSEER